MGAMGEHHWHIHLTGLGLVPAESRQVKSMPSQLSALVPLPTDNNLTMKPSSPDIEKDTMPLIIKKSKRTAYQSKKLAAKLLGGTIAETLRNDSNFILDYIKYKKDDPLHEQIRSPRRLVYDRCGDCDCFAVTLATLLINQGIKFKFRIAKYQAGDWAHIYIIVPNDQSKLSTSTRSDYTVLDPVTNKHDYEVPFVEKKDYDMKGNLGSLQFLDGLSDCAPGNLGCGCGVPDSSAAPAQSTTSIMVGSKSLEIQGVEPASNLLDKLKLPYQKSTDAQGNIVYNVSTPTGSQTVAGLISVSPSEQDKLTNDLLAPSVSIDSTAGKSTDLTSAQKKAGLLIAVGVALTTVVLDYLRSKPKAALGALPRKKIARMKI